jgi:hypothetical protein
LLVPKNNLKNDPIAPSFGKINRHLRFAYKVLLNLAIDHPAVMNLKSLLARPFANYINNKITKGMETAVAISSEFFETW